MKLWHDDVRPAPEGWVHARTNDEAKEYFKSGEVETCSLDHDLGYSGTIPSQCNSCDKNGMVEYRFIADDTVIESLCPDCNGTKLVNSDAMYVAGTSDDDGTKLAEWLAENSEYIPQNITIHSWNHDGADRMADILVKAGAKEVHIAPYRI
jgi:hypothetical protein